MIKSSTKISSFSETTKFISKKLLIFADDLIIKILKLCTVLI